MTLLRGIISYATFISNLKYFDTRSNIEVFLTIKRNDVIQSSILFHWCMALNIIPLRIGT